MQQAVYTTQIDECAVIGYVFDNAFQDLTFFQVFDQFGALFSTGFFQHGAARDNDIAAAAIHFQDLERLRRVHQRGDVAHGADIDLAARQEGNGPVQVDREATLHASEDHAIDALLLVELLFQLDPAFFALGLFAAQHRFAVLVFHAFYENFDFIALFQICGLAGAAEFLQRDAAFGLQADINQDHVIVDRNDDPFYYSPFKRLVFAEGFFQKLGKTFICHGCDVPFSLVSFPAIRLYPAVSPQNEWGWLHA